MKKQAFNPFLPLDTYIPDGEPHVFGDRVYLYGSHDKEGGETFCMLDYEVWSAPVDDLSDWSCRGTSYSAAQDPLSKETGRPYLYAPDCVQGKDGRYYLYYCLSGDKGQGGYFGPVGVAVCDTPDGKFEFLGHVRFPDGTLCTRFVPFDPAVINDGGVIRLYYGTWYPFDQLPRLLRPAMRRVQAKMFGKSVKEIKREPGGVMGPVCCTLQDDMLTVTEGPKRILPADTRGTPFESGMSKTPVEGHRFFGHGFYEGASIRRIGDTYYFIYSSVNNHELCYATSKYSDRDFTYRGVIVSNGDVGYRGRRESDRLNHTGTTHGSIEKINGRWYVFYHRQTHGSDYSRQACAEPIEILPDGSIPQVEITSCGLNGGPLKGEGEYPAVICCNLTNGRMPHGGNAAFSGIPMVTNEGEERFLTGLKAGTLIVYKYFDLSKTREAFVTVRGKGTIALEGASVDADSREWKEYRLPVTAHGEREALAFRIMAGELEMLKFRLSGREEDR